ncbi:MAG: hypothetical protein NTV94_19920 [Planctomycetota bacterium]|nr:hypothetical protein [Planctomycetota bacterium]
MRILTAGFTAACLITATAGGMSPPPLAGPRVAKEAATLVSRGFDGKVALPEPTPEEAALHLLTLSVPEQEHVNAELTARARILDQFTSTQLELLTKLGVAFGTNDKTDQANLLLEAMFHLQPLAARGEPANARAFDASLKQFWDAYCKSPAQGDAVSPTRNRFEVMTEANLAVLGKQIEASVARMLGSGDLVYDLLFKNVPLNDAQRVKLRDMVADFTQRTKGEATDEDNKRLFFMILPILENNDQRKAFMTNIRVISGQEKAPRGRAAGEEE